jgi:hypothetical protein
VSGKEMRKNEEGEMEKAVCRGKNTEAVHPLGKKISYPGLVANPRFLDG